MDDTGELQIVACKLCARNPPTTPVVTSCVHSFCWQCLSGYLQNQAKPCPVCTATLSSAINVVPYLQPSGSLILYLPTSQDLEQNYDTLDLIRTTLKLPNVVALPDSQPRPSSVEASTKQTMVVFGEENSVSCHRHNLFMTSRIEEMQWKASRAKHALLPLMVAYWKKVAATKQFKSNQAD